jgi:hypothetical protein
VPKVSVDMQVRTSYDLKIKSTFLSKKILTRRNTMRKKIFLWLGAAFVICFAMSINVNAGCGHFYKDGNFLGSNELSVCAGKAEYADLSKIGWDDKISSYKIDDGTQCVITKKFNFSGDYLYINKSEKRFMDSGWDDQISSIKCAAASYFTGNDMPSAEGEVYIHPHFAGRALMLDTESNYRHLVNPWNDVFSSAKIGKGLQCKFYKDKDFKNGETFGPDKIYPEFIKIGWDDLISSIKCSPTDN